jgi:beta-galactosidase
MDRGEYVTDKKKQYLAAYDDIKPNWGNTHRASWKMIATKPYVAGCFIWTGFDYRGEPQPFEWPSVSSVFGCMDVCGFPKTAFYIHQAQWLPESQPVLQLVPHWNWSKDSIGKNIRVMAMSNAETIKLKLNGKWIGEQKVDYFEMNTFQVPYQPGKLEAFGYRNGKEVSHFVAETTGDAVGLQLIPDRNTLAGDGQDAIPITVKALDAKGRPIETANLPIEFEISGPATIIGLGNGNHNNHESDKGNKYSLYNGLAQVIIQSNAASVGDVVLTAKSGNLKVATIHLTVKEAVQIPSVPVAKISLILDRWKLSPFYTEKPDPNMEVANYDMNTWGTTKPGSLQKFADSKYALYRVNFKPYTEECEKGGRIVFKAITGKAEFWLDKQLVGKKEKAEKGDFTVNMPAGDSNRTLSVLIETDNGRGGLGGVVKVLGKE